MSIHPQNVFAYKEGLCINVLHASRVDDEKAAEARGDKDRFDETLGFITWDEIERIQSWALKESDKKLFKVEGLVLSWEKGGPAVYCAAPSRYFAAMELIDDEWSHAYLQWMAKQRREQPAKTPRNFPRIQDRVLAYIVDRYSKTNDGEALLRQMLGLDIVDELARQYNEALANLEDDYEDAQATIKRDLKAAADKLNPHEKVKHSLTFLSEVTGSNDAARKILKLNGVNALSALPAEFCSVVIREAERAAVMTLAAKHKKTVKGLSKMTATQLRSVSNRLLG